jgi:hypothetical protein
VNVRQALWKLELFVECRQRRNNKVSEPVWLLFWKQFFVSKNSKTCLNTVAVRLAKHFETQNVKKKNSRNTKK